MSFKNWEEKLAASKKFSFFEVRLNHLSIPEDYRLKTWLFNVGDVVKPNDIIAIVETETCTLDIEVFVEATLAERFFEIGEQIPDGAMIARLDPVEMTKPGGESAEGG